MTLKQRLAAWFCDFICPLFDLYSETGTLYLVSQQRVRKDNKTARPNATGLSSVVMKWMTACGWSMYGIHFLVLKLN